jgi:hypothetical protein
MAHSNSQTFPEGEPKGGKRQTEASEEKNHGLNGAIDAAVGGQASAPDPVLDPPTIQPAGRFPGIADAIADMSKPPPKPPVELPPLSHSPSLPRVAFRVKPRERNGVFMWMVNLPYKTSEPGEAFTHPVSQAILKDLAKECPQLVPQRYEIRLVCEAGESNSKYSLFEFPADPAATPSGEDKRRAVAKVLADAELEWRIAEKVGGKWGSTEAEHDGPVLWPEASLLELADPVYSEPMWRNMEHSILRRYRKKVRS